MQRLSGLDTSFLYAETPSVHMHTLKIGVLDLDGMDPAAAYGAFCARLAPRAVEVPSLRRVPVFVPAGLDHPRWREHSIIHVRRHVRRLTLPPPAGHREVDDAIARIASEPLPRDRPLWQVWWLDGRADGSVVFVAKLHHALADGTAAAGLLAHIMGASAEVEPPLPHGRCHSSLHLLREAARARREALDEVRPLLDRTTRGALNAVRHCVRARQPLPGTHSVPRTSLNGSIGPRRSFATQVLPLSRVRAVKRRLGVSLNAVVLALVNDALTTYFSRSGELPAGPLVASVPMSSEGTTAPARLHGNRVANMVTSLCSDVPGVAQRVHAIHEAALGARRFQQKLGMDTMERWVELLPPAMLGVAHGFYRRAGLADRLRPFANVIVSNVRGPSRPLSAGPARLRRLYSSGPIVEGIGLNITAWSYCNELAFSAIADAARLPDAHAVTRHLPGALSALEHATREDPHATSPRDLACA